MSIKKATTSDNQTRGLWIPLMYQQHQESLKISKPFSFLQIGRRFSVLSSLSLSFEPAFRTLTSGTISLSIKDKRRQEGDPLEKYLTLTIPLTETRDLIITDFPTIDRSISSPYLIEIDIKASGIKFNQVVGYLRLVPHFLYTNTSSLPEKVTVRELGPKGRPIKIIDQEVKVHQERSNIIRSG